MWPRAARGRGGSSGAAQAQTALSLDISRSEPHSGPAAAGESAQPAPPGSLVRRVFVEGENRTPWIAGGTPAGALNPCPAPACLSFPAWTVGARTAPVAEVHRGAPSAGSAPFSLLFR